MDAQSKVMTIFLIVFFKLFIFYLCKQQIVFILNIKILFMFYIYDQQIRFSLYSQYSNVVTLLRLLKSLRCGKIYLKMLKCVDTIFAFSKSNTCQLLTVNMDCRVVNV